MSKQQLAGDQLSWTRSSVRGGTLVKLQGTINEHLDRHKLIEGLAGTVIFDLDQVNRITSFGIREWVAAMKALHADYVGFVRCRTMAVMQFNSVAEFGGRGQLVSFYAPYICPDCEKTIDALIDLRLEHARVKSFEAPPVQCPDCKSAAELDDLPEAYFSYAATIPTPTPPAVGAALIDGTPPPARQLSVTKEVVENVTGLWLSGGLNEGRRLRRAADGLEGRVVLVCAGLEEVSDEGVAALDDALSPPELEAYLARVPEVLLAKWAARKQLPPRAQLVSGWFSHHCGSCTASGFREWSARRPTSLNEKCTRCGGSVAPETPAIVQSLLEAFPAATTPPEVQAYLSARQIAPRGGSGTGTGTGRSTPAPASPQPDAVGQQFSRYQLLRKLGQGGMAEVFLARQSGAGGFSKQVVLKRMLEHLCNDENFKAMFLDEARLAARISHPNVTQIFDLGQEEGRLFIVMEYVKGTDLSNVLSLTARLKHPLPAELAVRVLADICAGLHAAHTCVDEAGASTPIIHRDVSPHNVLLSYSGLAKLSDFGIAKAQDGHHRTPSHQVRGKLRYMAPEQLRGGSDQIDCRADLFPVGLMLFESLTGEQLFKRESDVATMWALLNDPIPPVTLRRPELPALADTIVAKALSRNRDERYQTAQELQRDLEALLVKLGRPAGVEQLERWLKELLERAQAAGLVDSSGELPPRGLLRGITPSADTPETVQIKEEP